MMLRRAVLWISLVLAVVAVRVYWFTAPRVVRGDRASIERHLVEKLRDARIGSAALVLMHKGEIGPVHRFGSQKGELYQVASVSKAVTAFGVMKLVQDGKLKLDEPVMGNRYTVRQLLSHTSGIEDGREPGIGFAYGNRAYTVLQKLIEDHTQRPFARFMKDEVLRPLGMNTATYELDEARAQLAAAFDGDLVPREPIPSNAPAAAALYASANDLAQFARAFVRDNPVLTRATLQQMIAAQPATSGTWGLGITRFGPIVVGHDGGTAPAWGAMVRVNPATGNGMVLVVSGGRGAVNQLGHDWVYWETGELAPGAWREFAYRHVVPATIAIILGLVVVLATRRA